MGMFDYTCSVSGLPIGEGTPVRLTPLMPGDYYEEGKSVMSTNELWVPMMLPLRAVYNSYGSVKDWEPGPKADSFFKQLEDCAVEREVGENPVHDVAVRKGMSREDYLMALWEGRIQTTGAGRKILPVVQAMVREDIWQLLVQMEITQDDYTYSLASVKKEYPGLGELAEFKMVGIALGWLGFYWRPGSCCGPQHGAPHVHRQFHQGILDIISRIPGE